ncbi:MAG: hypothetical protein NVSMB63_07800 [Sediminibacterium sp.]
MAGMAKIKKYTQLPEKPLKTEEAAAVHPPVRKPLAVADFTFKKFQKIAARVPFTQSEWAHILHLSERTLQRYAKGNISFEGIYTDRILHIQNLIEMGLETFTSADALYRWLKREKHVLGQPLNFESLYSSRGIQEVIDEIGRIQYGVYI